MAATIGAADFASAAGLPEKIPADWFTVEKVGYEERKDRRAKGLLSLASLEQRQEVLEHTREQLIQVNPCWAEFEFEDEVVYYPGEEPTGGGQRPFVFIPGPGCEEPTPDDPPTGDDHDRDPPPWANNLDPEYWHTQCEEAQNPGMWNCWIAKGRPCGPDDDLGEGCFDVDRKLVYPIGEDPYLVHEECPAGSPAGVCDVLIRSYNTDIDYGQGFIEMRHEDWRNCGENPQLCPEGTMIEIDCDAEPHLCELEVEIADPDGLELNGRSTCWLCDDMNETAEEFIELVCKDITNFYCSGPDDGQACEDEVKAEHCEPFADKTKKPVQVCYETCSFVVD